MAGEGSRFRNIGIDKPKHEIIARGKSLFHWSILSLSDFFDESFVFIARKEHSAKAFIERECQQLGLSKFEIVEIEGKTEGQASTVMLSKGFISGDESIAVFNIDTYVEPGNILKSRIPKDAMGYTPAFVAEGDKWSFVKTESPESNKVIEVSEKVRISNLGTIGFYYFRKWEDFQNIYETHKAEIKTDYRETYIAPMYRYLIENEKTVYTAVLKNDSIHILGTPQDIESFAPDYLKENTEKA